MKVFQALIFSILIIASVAERQFSMRELIIRIKFCQAKVNHFIIDTSIIPILDLQQMCKSA